VWNHRGSDGVHAEWDGEAVEENDAAALAKRERPRCSPGWHENDVARLKCRVYALPVSVSCRSATRDYRSDESDDRALAILTELHV
jgi:hypothetical protein